MKNSSASGMAVCIAFASVLCVSAPAQIQNQPTQQSGGQSTAHQPKSKTKQPARTQSGDAQTVQPYQSTEIKPYQATEIKPHQATEIKPYQATEIKPVQSTPVQPVQSHEIQSVQSHEIQSVQSHEIQSVQSTPIRANPPGYLPNDGTNRTNRMQRQGRGVSSLLGTYGISVHGVSYVIDNYASNTRTQVTSAGALTNSSVRVNPDHTFDWNSSWDRKVIHGRWIEKDGNILLQDGSEGKDWVLRPTSSPGGKVTVELWDQDWILYDGTPLR